MACFRSFGPSGLVAAALVVFCLCEGVSAMNGMCAQPVQEKLRFGVTPDREMAQHICCHNTEFAEPSGFFSQHANLFGHFDIHDKSHTFYDSVCGLPLFVAPRDRSMSEFQAESHEHGWPSFRDAEIVHQNVVELANGEVRSRCGTHLGHNLPDAEGDRYCINLVCIAGFPIHTTWSTARAGHEGHEAHEQGKKTALMEVEGGARAERTSSMLMILAVPAFAVVFLVVGSAARRWLSRRARDV